MHALKQISEPVKQEA